MPKITVAMAVYNDAAYVAQAINSILNQTYNDYEFLIINDGSTDETQQIIDSFSDKRMRIIHLEKNQGRPKVRNFALSEARGEYFAWMDGDDTSPPKRLEIQVDFMDKHQDISICGGYMQCFGESNHLVRVKTQHEAINVGIILYNSTLHGTNFMRLEDLHKQGLHYHEDLLRAQDYAFLGEAFLALQLRAANIPTNLLNCRYFKRPTMPTYHVKATKYVLKALAMPHDELSCYKHSILSIGQHESMPQIDQEEIILWADQIYSKILQRKDLSTEQFLRVMHVKMEIFLKQCQDAQSALRSYAKLPLGKTHHLKNLFQTIGT